MHLTRGAMEFLQEMIALDAMRLFRAVVSEVRSLLLPSTAYSGVSAARVIVNRLASPYLAVGSMDFNT